MNLLINMVSTRHWQSETTGRKNIPVVEEKPAKKAKAKKAKAE